MKIEVMRPIADKREIPMPREYRKYVKDDLKGVDSKDVFVINRDVFELSKIMDMIDFSIRRSNHQKTKQSIQHSKKLWKNCLKQAKGDYEKAVKRWAEICGL